MRLFVSVDIEGIAGVVSRNQTLPANYDYEAARVWMTDTVSACAEAAFAQGVSDVVVADSHLFGQNIIIDRLPERVQLVRGGPRPFGMAAGADEGAFDAAIMLGYHTGSTHLSGILGHTIRGLVLREVRLNDRVVSEAGFYAPLLGQFGIPVIGVSGDAECVAETQALLGDIEGAVVKWSYGHLAARSLTPAAAHKVVADMTRRAVSRIGTFKPQLIEGPIALQISFKHRPPAEVLSLLPGVHRCDAYTILTTLPDMVAVAKFMTVVTAYNPSEV